MSRVRPIVAIASSRAQAMSMVTIPSGALRNRIAKFYALSTQRNRIYPCILKETRLPVRDAPHGAVLVDNDRSKVIHLDRHL